MLISNTYTDNPIEYNNLCQAQVNYVGVDSLKENVQRKQTIIVALSGPNEKMVGDYFTKLEELSKNELDSIKLCQGLQVMPFADKLSGIDPQYKTNARIYVLNEDIKDAQGITTENSHFGKGGLPQIAIPNGKEMILKALGDKSNSLNHSIILINLNDYQSDIRLSNNVKTQLGNIKAEFSGSLSKEDGSIKLNNIKITKKAYNVIINRTKVHELTAEYNCLMKEYTDELQQKNKNYINNVKNDIQGVQDGLKVSKNNLEQLYKDIHTNPKLLAGFSKEDQEHLLNIDTCSPKATHEKTEYLKSKAIYLESKLSEIVREKLNIPKNSSLTKTLDFKEDLNMEKLINDYYMRYTSEDPHKIVDRILIHTPTNIDMVRDITPKEAVHSLEGWELEQKLLKRDLFCHLKSQDNLIQLINSNKDTNVNQFCNKKLKEVNESKNSCIDELKNNIKINGKNECPSFDDKSKYLTEKINSTSNQLEPKTEFITDNKMEGKINLCNENIMITFGKHSENSTLDKVPNMDKLTKIFDTNNFINKTIAIEKSTVLMQESRALISNLNHNINLIELRKEVLTKANNELENVDRYKDISQKYDDKILFKKSYQNSFQTEKNTYDNAKKFLESVGITSLKELNIEKEKLKKKENTIIPMKIETKNQRTIQDKLFKDTIKQKRDQQIMMKNPSELGITKGQFKNENVHIQLKK